jgi:hypothetical protein
MTRQTDTPRSLSLCAWPLWLPERLLLHHLFSLPFHFPHQRTEGHDVTSWWVSARISVSCTDVKKNIRQKYSDTSRDSSVRIAMGYTPEFRIPIGARFFSCPQCPDRLWGPNQPSIQWVPETISPRTKQQEREADHSTSTSAGVKHGGVISPLPPHTRLHGIVLNHLSTVTTFILPLTVCMLLFMY